MPTESNVVEIGRRHKSPPDWTGQVFGRLTVIKFSGVDRHGQRMWLCKCACGKETTRPAGTLKSGNTKSCGCLHFELLKVPKGKHPEWGVGYGIGARNTIISCYKKRAKDGGRVWNLTTDQAESIFRGNCHYCGKEPSHKSASKKMNGGYVYNGIDRIDNSKGYENGNVVSCCRRCNMAKNDMPYEEFVNLIERVHSRLVEQVERKCAS